MVDEGPPASAKAWQTPPRTGNEGQDEDKGAEDEDGDKREAAEPPEDEKESEKEETGAGNEADNEEEEEEREGSEKVDSGHNSGGEEEEEDEVKEDDPSKPASATSWVEKQFERIDDDTVQFKAGEDTVALRIPPEFKERWDVMEKSDAPSALGMEWVYGYRGRDSAKNIFLLPATGEVVYYTASVVVLYHPEAQTQRHYRGHDKDVECLAVHPRLPWCGSGQLGDDSHVHIWNFETLELLHKLEVKDTACALAFYHDTAGDGDNSLLACADGEVKPVLHVWRVGEGGGGDAPERIYSEEAANDKIHAWAFSDDGSKTLMATGKGFGQAVKTFVFDAAERADGGVEVKQGLFTRKIARPKAVLCVSFAENGDALTGDTDGNVMVWKGSKVVRVLKGAHSGSVADVCIMSDGSIVSGGLSDAAFVVFDQDYQLIGAGATLPDGLGCVRRIETRTFNVDEDGNRAFHLFVGTTTNCIVEVSFLIRAGSGTTEITDLDFEILVQGHAGEVRDVRPVPKEDQFFSCGDDQNIIMWDAVAHRAMWTHNTNSSPVVSVAVDVDGRNFVFGLESGPIYYADVETKTVKLAWEDKSANNNGEESEDEDSKVIACTMAFSPDNAFLAVGMWNRSIVVFEHDPDGGEGEESIKEAFVLTGDHTSWIRGLDWSKDSKAFRTNSYNHEIRFWSVESKSQITDPSEIDSIGEWDSQRCPVAFETLGLWSDLPGEPGDVDACDSSPDAGLMAAGNETGTIRLYKYPTTQPRSGYEELNGHAMGNVWGCSFLDGGSRLVTACGKEASLIQWSKGSPQD